MGALESDRPGQSRRYSPPRRVWYRPRRHRCRWREKAATRSAVTEPALTAMLSATATGASLVLTTVTSKISEGVGSCRVGCRDLEADGAHVRVQQGAALKVLIAVLNASHEGQGRAVGPRRAVAERIPRVHVGEGVPRHGELNPESSGRASGQQAGSRASALVHRERFKGCAGEHGAVGELQPAPPDTTYTTV